MERILCITTLVCLAGCLPVHNRPAIDEQTIRARITNAGYKVGELVAAEDGTYELTLVGDVSNLEFLRGIPLSKLIVAGPEKPSYARGPNGVIFMPAELKGPHICPLNDLTPLKGMPLKYLAVGETCVEDLSPLKGMSLRYFSIGLTHVKDLSPLKGMPIEVLHLDHDPVQDLTPLQGMPLRVLQIGYTQAKDLSPLRNAPLEILSIEVTDISDLAPLGGSPLKHLVIWRTRVSDLAPLRGMSLKSIILNDPQPSGMEVLRGMRSLELINYRPPDEFWRTHDLNRSR